jgi:hypothetical protein
MSKQNKVNPGRYTQRGRLTQDDAARELARQRSIGSQHTWQPVKKNALSALATDDEGAARSGGKSEGTESLETGSSRATPGPAARTARKSGAKTTARTKATHSRIASTSTVKKTTDKVKTGTAAKPAAKPAAKTTRTKTARRAVLARNTGGSALQPRGAAKRRKS